MSFKNELFLYSADPEASGRFYGALFSVTPAFSSPTFVIMALSSGFTIGFWRTGDVRPPAQASGGGCELAFKVANSAQVDGLHADWSAAGTEIAHPPVEAGFGYSFLALDPDGHRLRVYAPQSAG